MDAISQAAQANPELVTIIRPNAGWAALNLGELWSYRDLLFQMATRDFRARYKQSLLGKVWAVAQPILTLAVYYVVFGLILKMTHGNMPYSVFLLSGILLWQLFATSANLISTSLTGNAPLLNKIYFPRLLLPLSCAMACCVDFFFAFLVLLVLMLCCGVHVGWLALLCPLFVLLTVVVGLAFGLWLAPWNVTHRDVQQLVPIVLQVLLYLSGVFYSPVDKIPPHWQVYFYLNPMAALIQGFRWSLLGDAPPGNAALISIPASLLLLVGGLYFFRRHEADFADRL